MNYSFYETSILFFAWSFLAWLAETSYATIKEKNFRNRGFAFGPFCFIYGFADVLFAVFFQELRGNTFFLYLGCAAVATAVQWFTGKALERINQKKWWDYSDKKWNFDGYICLPYSLLWGLLGLFSVRYLNDFVLSLYHLLPNFLEKTVVFCLAAAGLLDFAGSLLSCCHMEDKLPHIFIFSRRMQQWTYRFAAKISNRMERRIKRAYPATALDNTAVSLQEEEKCSLVQLFWLFLIGAFSGDIVETIFCRLTVGIWMSRSSVVWGPFSVVWGLGIALVTALLYKDRDKQEHHIFFIGLILGGAYEYICSVFTEMIFGKVFWDYSGLPFNLGGRINLLYCIFWGFAAVIWMKSLYPKMAFLITWILQKTGRVLTAFCAVFMAVNLFVSVLALVRYDARANGRKASCSWEHIMDQYYDDQTMERIYPNAIAQ